ncbi:gliding motility-associated C-terminal domain-containing protein [Flavobacterium sp. 120]|uniref:T9SS type B sorting domain-containing protein n=1 Tax=Flavobacterium sp. 120 TaxID=2135626 RepID=UPI000EACAAF1|nr:gliding motility-associated C-terminal domain-containing protein [Flavobacterium sp. 120]RKS12915.1 putative repeat protein (TIGR01451 family) [Flavobacterium sp. 120]
MHNFTKSQSQVYLSLLFLILSLTFAVSSFAQAPALEMASVTPAADNGRVTAYTVQLQKNTNNPTGNTFANYNTPSALSTAMTVTQFAFTNSIYFGDTAEAPYQLLNGVGNVGGGNDNNQYTSYGAANGTGLDIATNFGVRIVTDLATAGTQPGNGRVKMGEVTIVYTRGTQNPLLHFKGLGGAIGGVSLTSEFTIKSILNSSGAEVLTSTNISQRSGTNLVVDNVTKTINNSYTGVDNPATVNSGRGTIQFTGNDVRTIVLEIYANRNGTATNVAWSGADAFYISTSIGETDLLVTKTINNITPIIGSNVVFNINSSNVGSSNATGVSVNDLLPTGYTYVSHIASSGTYNSATGVWTIGNLNDGATSNLAITATVNSAGNYTNTATILGNESDPVLSNNTANVTPIPFSSASQRNCNSTATTVPNLSFQNPVFFSGSDNGVPDVGDVYRFPNVTTGIDALLTISGLSGNGGTPTLTAIDQPAVTEGTDGFDDAFQPSLATNGGNPATASFAINFVTAGGTFANPANINYYVSALDIDGDEGTLREFVEMNRPDARFNSNPTNLTFATTATTFRGTATNVTTQPGTGVTPEYAYTAYFENRNSMVFTLGAQGGTTVNRLYSLYFRDITYTNRQSTVVTSPFLCGNVSVQGGGNVAGSTVTLSGPSSQTTTTDSNGNYSFAIPVASLGTYTVTQTNLAGYTNVSDVQGANDNIINNNVFGFQSITGRNFVDGSANLGVVKTVNNATPNVGSNVIFTIVASNAGPGSATSVIVTDQLPAGYTFVSSTPSTGTYTSGTGVWAIGSLANGASATLSIVATVNATGSYANTATIAANETDPTPANNTATNTPVPVPQSNVGITKTASTATPNVGSNVTFTLTASNAGPSAATGVSVTDQLPAGYTFVSSTPSTGTYTSGTGVWAIGSLANGASATLSIVATVNATGSYANTATIAANETDPTPANNTATSTPVPVPQSNVGITKTASTATPNVGSNVTFTLTASNAGPSAATGVSVTDQLPAGYTFVSSTPSTGTYTSGTGIWAIGSLANGASATLSIVATVNATGSYANTATIAANETDPTPANNTATNTPVPVPQSNVGITKTASTATPNVGSNVTFTLTASNAGPSAATGVSVTDQLPAGYTFVSSTPSTGTYTSGTGVWAIGSLANGASATLSIVATVNATGSYANTATIAANETDPTPANNTATSTPVPVPQSNVGITKTASTATPNVGSNVTFTLTASNAGPSAATGVSVTDQLPAGYTFVSSTPSTGTYTSGTGVWAIGSLANGASATLAIVATVNATGSYANTATIAANETDPTPANNTATNTPVPVPQSNVGITKTASTATPNVGSNVTFTLTASNAGPSAATGVSVTDQLPAGYTFVSSTPSTGTYTSGTGVWAIGSLANGASATLSIVATVNATGSYANTATIAANETDPTPANNTATSTPVPVPQSNVGITKTASTATPNVGSNITFTLTASNAGPSAATGVSVTDLLPAGYTFVSSTPSTGTYTSGTGIWAIGSLANGASATLAIVATVNATGSYANTATIAANETDPTPANNTATSTPVPVPQSNVGITKTASTATPNVGSNITFTLTASNAGPSAATGVSVTDQLPAGYTFVSSTPSTGTYTSGTGVWAIGSLANGASATLSIVATVNATGSYANTATIAANETDPTPANNTATNTPVPVPQSNVGITKTASTATPNVGSNITFTLTASNAGPSAATGVSVTDQLPAGYTFVSSTPSTGTYTSGTGIWAIGSLANGASATLAIVATVNATGSYANTATIAANETDPTPANNTATSTPVPVPQSNVGITKTASTATPNVGSNITFTLTASNAGPSAATGVSVTDQLPAGYTFVSSTPSTGTYTSGTGIWAIGSLANGASATLAIVATVNATGSYANTATIAANETDPTPANNTATNTPVPVPQSNVGITKTASTATPNVGSNITFTLTASNAGPSAATGVSVTDQLPAGYTFVSATPSTGTYTSGTGVWAIGSLANGASATLAIVATVNATGSYANTATIAANETDPTPANNTATNTPVPVPQSNVGITKTASTATPNVGSNITFTLTASNAGPSAATGVSVTDQLPAGYTFVSATPSTGTYTSGTGVWAIGSLANGASATLAIVATVNATGSYANTGTIAANETDPTPANNTATNTPVPVPQSNVGITKTASTATPNVGSNITFTLTASNAGPSAATGVSVTDQLPAGYTFVSATPSTGTYTSGTGIWAIGSLANGASATLAIVATVNATGSYANTATIAANETDPTPANNTATNTPVPVPQSNVGITKTASTATPNVGSNITFTLTASNAGPSAATGVSVTDQLPAGYTFVSSTPSTGTYTSGTGIWAIGSLANGASATLAIVATVNATGSYANTATIAANEADPTPANNTATNTPVPINIIDAVNDGPTTVATATTPTTVQNVTANDRLNGVAVTAANTDVTPITTGPLSVDATGVLTLAANTPSGTYTITYQLCEAGANPANCDTATATVVVANPIDAVNDGPTTVATATTPTTVQNVTANDRLNGVAVTAANTDVTPITTGPLSVDATGVLTLAANTPSGTYTITYQLCESGANPANCDTATATVVVANPIDAVNDGPTTVATATTPTTVQNVTANDRLNGVAVTAANTDVTPITTGPLSVDATGVLTLAANTPSGTYTITYQLCEAGANPANCDTATATVVVANPIDAVNDGPTTVATATTPTTVQNVTANDTLNGVAVTAANTDVTPITTGPLSVDATGVLTLAANTPSGTYTITYQLCETGANPANCDTATATVVVANPIDAVNDGPTTVATATTPTTVQNVTANDRLNGVAVTAANTDVTPITTGPLSVDATGVLTLAANTPSGTYTITYQLCESGANPANCDTATATVVVANPIDVVNDGPTTVATATTPTTVQNVTANDTLNGVAVTAANTDVTPITTGPLSVDATGVLTLAANTPSGTYTITYQLCESGANPANCDTATATVVVANPIDAVNDGPTTVATATTPTTVQNVTANDRLNGVAVTAANTDVTPITTGPLSVDATGVLTLAANTPSGTYTITYQLCESGANPANCDTATATVVVANPIDAVNDGPTTVATATTPTTVQNVTANDRLNGVAVTAANTDVTPITTGPLSVDATGVVTLAANTPSGTYTITYQLCESGANPANCDTATATVVVANPIDAVNDGPTTVATATTPTTVQNVTANDRLNGVAVTAANTDVTPITTGPLSVDATGVLTLAANTPSGTYTITYQLCETGANPANCDTATATVVVSNPIDAVNDGPTTVATATTPTTVQNVTANDTLNGVAVTAANTDVTPITTGPLSVDATGVLTLAANTPSGTYTITYQLCESGANPANCDTATATVVVSNPIDAVNDGPTTVATATTPTTVQNVTANDRLNGVAVTAANTDVTPITTGPLSIDATGVLTLAANTPSGTYTITYQLCESGANPANCDTATATVVVANPIDAVNDGPTTVATATTPTTVQNVTANDRLNGVAVTAANTDVTPITTGPLSIDATGVLTLAANTPSGTYTITYQLCESGANPANCDTATATVVVSNPIDAVNDGPTTVATATTPTTVQNVTANDRLNGVAVTAANTDVTPITTGPLSVDATGVLTLAANTPSGTYTITYQLCEAGANPANCDTATATVVVSNPIDAVNDGPTTVATATTPTTVQNVTANDRLNGVAVTAANTDVTPITTGPLSIDATGVLTLAANTPSGTYTITYQLCESGANPANCDTATATVVVANPIDAVNDGPTTVATATTPTTVQNVTANDRLNGVAVTAANTDVTPITTGPLSIDATGVLTLAANTPSGTYTITYQLCESGANPANCDTATATVVVANPIDAVNDGPTTVATATTPTTVQNVTANDRLNGVAVTAANTDVTPITTGPLSVDATGVLTLAANTPSGTYTITYQLCEAGANPANCDTATATVVVANPIDAVNDGPTTVATATTPTTVQNVTANDTLNGVAVTAANTDVTPITTGPLSVDATGVLTLAANTPSGTYTITYQLCETGANPANCDTATATVVVANPIDAVNDGPTTVATATTPTTVQNVTANDRLNGVAVTAANTDVTPITTGPLSVDATGVLTLAANTPSGTYTITYQLCESGANPANCDTATATVVVANPIDVVNDGPTTVATATTPTTVQNVTANDTLNGVAVTAANTDVTPITTGPLSVDATGVLTLAANTPSGTYTITYQLCESGANPANCDTATATVVVANPIDAVNDGPTTVATATTPTTVQNVTANDTLNGVAVTAANTDVTPITTGPLSVDATGVVTLAANTPSGTYTITYQLCESGANPANCDTATATVVVANPIDAVNDGPTTVATATTPTTVQNVTANDTLNGVAVTAANTDVTPITTGPLSVDATGVLTLAANTPSGTYTITYQLCEAGADPANCDTATATVVVTNPIDAVNDGPTTVATAATPTTVQNVTANDRLNGVAVTAANTDVTPITTGPLSVDATGVLTLAANTPSGTYTITYQLCESGANPANCDTAIATVVVANPIVANNDVTGGLPGQTTGSVLGNDTLSGIPPVNPSDVILTVTVTNTYLTLNPDGSITIASGAPSGPQTLEYQICEIGSNPLNCGTATVTVNVGQFAIDALVDDYTSLPINGGTGGTTASVLDNDSINGVTLNSSDVILTLVGTAPTGFTLNADGTVTVAAGLPSGLYMLFYQICELINPSNCDIANAKILIINPIDAVNDGPTTVATAATPTTVQNVTANDRLNGVAVTAANTDVTPITTGPLSVDATGVLTLAANTPSGTYTITYQLCESGANPANCDTATATVVVANPIDVVNDGPTTVATAATPTTVQNVTANDTLNGVAVTAANTDVTPITTGPLSVDATGVLTLAANTPSGTYTITYQLCEAGANPANCDTATATVVVANPIDAVNDGPTTVATAATPTTVQNVTANDRLNGVAVTAANTDVTPITTGPLSIDATGVLTLAANTPSGTYTITYQLCEAGANPANCDTATATVVVANPIDAVNDGPTTVATATTPTTVQNVTANDRLNGVAVTAANTDVTPITTGPLSVDATGVLTLAANTPSGTYTITYQLCESGANPANCDTATATVVVANPIDAVNDGPTTVATATTPTTVQNVTANDRLNGVAVTAANTDVTPITTGPLSVDATGVLTLAANTPSGTYTITYQLCEAGANPANCDTATATVVVANPIDAVNDGPTTVATATTPTTVQNVMANDTLNGVAVTAANTDVTPITTGPLSVDATGVLTLAANTPSGTYTITYQLCETGANPANCDTATATVVVANPIDAVNDGPTTVATATTPTTVQNVTANDRLNGVAVTAANTDVTPITTGPLSVDATGVLTLAANTPSGTYTITYQLCESGANPANCDTATATVVVANPIDVVNDGPTTVATATTPTTVQNVTANDTLNGVAVTAANTDVTPITTGPLSVDATGVLTLAANTPSGTYTITYQLCESGANPANCDTATATVVVANPIDAVNDGPTTVATATTPTTVQNVTANDRLNGVAVTAANTDVTPITTGPLSVDATGVLTLAANTPSGTYTITYQLCESGANPANCDTATATVVVANPIDAVNDGPTTVATATTPTTVQNVTANDRLNGVAVTAANTDVTPITTGPLSVDATGVVTLAANTPSGTYTITYQLCESGANPANCDTATATVIVANPIDAVNDGPTTVATATTPTTVQNVTANDRLNGVAVTAANTDVTPITTGPLSVDATGVVTLAANTPSGTYTITYQLCETGANPANCDTATATVVVSNPIDAVNDGPTTVATAATPTTVQNVTANDTLNGVAVTAANTDVTPITTGPLSVDATGVLTLAANTPSGTYTITYQLCESGANPANCDTATATVVVSNPIDAVNDGPTTVATATTPTTVQNVTANDRLNGVAVTAANTDVTPITTGPLSIDATGVLTLAANTPSGTYTITYQLCESGANPANCDTATATVVVANPIDAVNDGPTTVATATTPTTVQNVTANDRLNGVAVTAANTDVTPITTGPLSIDATGVLTLAANTPSGTYTITYQLCESGANPANCDTATATVVVANPIDAVNDGPTTVATATTPTTVQNVTANDRLNGVAVTAANTDVTPITTGPLSVDATGVLTLAANTPSGTYTITYQLCESGANPANCDTATATVVVANPIDAVNDGPTTVATATTPTTVQNVTANDRLNGVAVTAANTDVTPITTGPLSVDATGVLTLAANTPSGTYTITYQLCEAGANPANCDTATATVVVANPIDAVNDGPTTVATATTPTTVQNVTANDTLNGVAVTAANTDVTPITTGPLSVDATGVLTLAANTPSGTYTITYQLCETGANPANCDTATATVVVANPIDAVNDGPTTVATATTPTTVQNVTANDRLNGVAVTAANTDVTPITTGPLSVDATGVLTLAANTPSGTYTITYQLCESGANPANCDTATATVVVANPIDVVNDGPTTVATATTPTTVQNVTANDTLNGVAVTAANTDVTPITTGPLSVDATGVLTLAANTPSGTYTITYQLCESGANPANCDTATATVVVANPIDAVNDGPTTVATATTPTTVQNVTANDTLNGVAVTAANTDVTPITTGPLSVDATGVVTLAANTPSGTYTITYQLCESGANPANCDTATATVVVANPIDAVNDGPTTVATATTPTTVQNVTANDTLNGVAVTAANTDVTPITTGPLSVDATGVLTLAANTPSGTYTITYQLCEAGADPANCDTATATVVVTNPIDAVNDGPTTVATAATPTTVQNVTANDRLNGVAVTAANTDVTPITTGPLSVDATGVLTLAANTPSGTYTITYQLCESGANPANCDTAIATVVVANPIVANNDVTGGLPGQTTGSVLGNDTLSGIPPVNPSDVILTVTVTNTYLTLNPDGSITIASGAPSGPQTLEYQICEIGSNPLNCGTATVTVNVGQFAIDALVDDYTSLPINGGTGGTTASVLDNDSINGVTLNSSDVILTLVGTAPTGFTLNADGTVTVAAGLPSGLYMLFYQICELINPSNCDIANAKILIINPIDAVNDGPTTVATAATPTTVQNVTANDRLNGVAVTAANTDVTPITTGPLSVDATGVLTLAANTPSGTYTITYQLCESGANPANCDTATATVVVANPIDVVNDGPTTVATAATPTTVQNVTANDTLNGVAVTAANTDVTPITTGPLSVDATGVLTLAANTPSGTYTITYQLCEAGANPANCDTATATVVVANPIDAVNDGPTTVATAATPTTVQNVTANDRLNGVAVTAANTDVTPITTGPLSVDATGVLTLAANTPSGTYTITYQLCEAGANPANCDTATATVVVANPIDAVNDGPTTVATATTPTTVQNVTANDRLNGVAVTAANTDVTPITTGPLSVDATGVLTLAANTPSGTYTITYQLCEVGANPANCDTATATVVVSNPIDAVNDGPTTVATATTPTTVQNVTANDRLNGVAVTAANTDVTPITTGPLSVDATGVLTLAANTPSGTYTITYQLCEVGANPANCDTATATVIVANTIVANNDVTAAIDGAAGGITPPLTGNDTLNGSFVVIGTQPGQVTLGVVAIPIGFVLNGNGTVTVPPNTPSGNYTITYTICEVGNNSNCSTVSSIIVVTNGATIIATNNSIGPVDGIKGGDLGINILDNDILNGMVINPSDVFVTQMTDGPITINANGTVTLLPNTAAGTYVIEYSICEKAKPSNCARAFLTVIVAESPKISIVKTAVFNDENGDGFAQAGETISYSFSITNMGNTPLSNVIVKDNLPGLILSGNAIPLLEIDETNNTAYQAVYRLTQNDINLGSVSNQAEVTGVSPNGTIVRDLSDDASMAEDKPTVLAVEGCLIEIFNAVAPNGSGDNKIFRIRGLECYTDNTVEIYNRWGVLVFERSGYNNDDRAFRGISEGRVTVKQSEELPEGTYYYILKYKDSAANSHEKAGYLYINR